MLLKLSLILLYHSPPMKLLIMGYCLTTFKKLKSSSRTLLKKSLRWPQSLFHLQVRLLQEHLRNSVLQTDAPFYPAQSHLLQWGYSIYPELFAMPVRISWKIKLRDKAIAVTMSIQRDILFHIRNYVHCILLSKEHWFFQHLTRA